MIIPQHVVGHALAQINPGLPINGTHSGSYPTFNAYFNDLIGLAMNIATGVAILMFVYAGFLYSRSRGDAATISTAKELVSGVLIGLAILFLIRLILPTLGIIQH